MDLVILHRRPSGTIWATSQILALRALGHTMCRICPFKSIMISSPAIPDSLRNRFARKNTKNRLKSITRRRINTTLVWVINYSFVSITHVQSPHSSREANGLLARISTRITRHRAHITSTRNSCTIRWKCHFRVSSRKPNELMAHSLRSRSRPVQPIISPMSSIRGLNLANCYRKSPGDVTTANCR